MNNRLDPSDQNEAAREEAQIFAEYNERFQRREYRAAFYPPQSGEWNVDGLFPEGYFQSAKVLLQGVLDGSLHEGIEGIAAVFLSRHYLELAIKYTL